ncbi:MAG: ATP-binding cassette domain-containing protein [bacterium]|nr:ATP-binding cassette domain-containing protein [bacterium]
MQTDEVIIRFNAVSFEYGHTKPILTAATFSVRRGAKVALMGQNGAGKTTIFQLITGTLKPETGSIAVAGDLTMATARQVIPRDQLNWTVREFFEAAFSKKVYDIDPRIDRILDVVHLAAPHDRTLRGFSGGEQARLLLAYALIQDPDLLLLDEPTNNLDTAGIEHLTKFLVEYKKTCIVISHDAEFLNAFTAGVLYLESATRAVEQYVGNYLTVVADITARLDRERMKNARLSQDIENRKEQANFFGQKGGHMRDVARKMREKIEELEGEVVNVRQEDKTIRNFVIPCEDEITGVILTLTSVTVMEGHETTTRPVVIELRRKERLLLAGPNGIGKTTLLERLASGHATGEHIARGTRVGYYRQDFSTLDFDATVYRALVDVATHVSEQELRSMAAGFLIDERIMKTRIGDLSEGLKGLVAFAQLVLLRPGLLFLDEPTNHINFRHLPVIAKALDRYDGAMVLVSHVPDFVSKIRIDQTLDLGTLPKTPTAPKYAEQPKMKNAPAKKRAGKAQK